jgi:hypothetical protein
LNATEKYTPCHYHKAHTSTSRYIFTIAGGAISWSLKKQPVITLSTTEAEFIATTHMTKELLWITSLLSELA